MERIRIVKRKRKSPYIVGILVTLIFVGVAVWFLWDSVGDRSIIQEFKNEQKGMVHDTTFHEQSNNDMTRYVSFIEKRVSLQDTLDKETTTTAVNYFDKAVNEIGEKSTIQDSLLLEDSTGSELVVADSIISPEQEGIMLANLDALNKSGNKLLAMQKQEFPQLEESAVQVKQSLEGLNYIESPKDESEKLKKFFIASSQLVKEIREQPKFNQLSYLNK